MKIPCGSFHLSLDLEEIQGISKYQVMWPSGGKLSIMFCSTMLNIKLEAIRYLLQSFTEPSKNHPMNLINNLTPEGHSCWYDVIIMNILSLLLF